MLRIYYTLTSKRCRRVTMQMNPWMLVILVLLMLPTAPQLQLRRYGKVLQYLPGILKLGGCDVSFFIIFIQGRVCGFSFVHLSKALLIWQLWPGAWSSVLPKKPRDPMVIFEVGKLRQSGAFFSCTERIEAGLVLGLKVFATHIHGIAIL